MNTNKKPKNDTNIEKFYKYYLRNCTILVYSVDN